MASGPLQRTGLKTLVEQAAAAEPEQARAARAEIHRRRLADPATLPDLLKALAEASEPALEASGTWLFFPEEEEALRLGLELAAQAQALLDLAQARPGPWWREGLAGALALRGGAPLRRLLGLARAQAWAEEVAAALPPGLVLPGGESPELWLAGQRVGGRGRRRLGELVVRRDWAALAVLDRAELTLACAQAGFARGLPKGPVLVWPGGDPALLEQICALTAREGLKAALLAEEASRQEGRVVVLLGNASLGGPPLWAAPGPWEQSWARLRSTGRPPRALVSGLARLRARRLAGPWLLQALWDLRCAVGVAGRGWAGLRSELAQAEPWLAPGQAGQVLEGGLPLAPGELPWPQARRRVAQTLAWARSLEAQARRALSWVWGLAAAAGRLSGGHGLVLPWIDKFAASTGKAADHAYLAELTALLARLDPPPLLLLVDETRHPDSVSLREILRAAARLRPGLTFRGLGCFGGRPEPRDPRTALLQAAPGAHVVAWRPLPGPHPGAELSELLAGRAQGRPLTPAGRDGAPWLLAGTALACLGSPGEPQGRQEPAPWLLCGHGFVELGRYFQARVRQMADRRGPAPGASVRRWRAYVHACGLD